MMEWSFRIYEGATAPAAPPTDKAVHGHIPFIVTDWGDLRSDGSFNTQTKALDCPVTDWLSGPCTMLMTEHVHDGTMLFTYEAISAISQAAAEYMDKQGGRWRSSKVWLMDEFNHSTHPTRKRETVTILLQPIS